MAPVADKRHFPEILKSRTVRHGGVFDQRVSDGHFRRSGEMQELVDLMRADVAQDPAVAFALEIPVRAGLEVLLVRGKGDDLDHAANRSGLDQF